MLPGRRKELAAHSSLQWVSSNSSLMLSMPIAIFFLPNNFIHFFLAGHGSL